MCNVYYCMSITYALCVDCVCIAFVLHVERIMHIIISIFCAAEVVLHIIVGYSQYNNPLY